MARRVTEHAELPQISRAAAPMRSLAKRLLAEETRGYNSADTKATAAFHACEKLQPPLSSLMGKAGFHALVTHSLALASAKIPALRAVWVKPDGLLQGLDELAAQADAREISESGVVLLAHLLGLLVEFIGEDLTLRLLRQVWPNLSPDDGDFGGG